MFPLSQEITTINQINPECHRRFYGFPIQTGLQVEICPVGSHDDHQVNIDDSAKGPVSRRYSHRHPMKNGPYALNVT